MTETRFVLVSEWMERGNINEFLKTDSTADRLGLVCFSFKFPISSLTIRSPPQLVEVAKGLIYMHEHGIVHGDLKGVRFGILPSPPARNLPVSKQTSLSTKTVTHA